MRQCTVSMLLPFDKKKIEFYEDFLLQYSTITAANLIVAQLLEEQDDSRLLKLFNKWHSCIDDYKFADINFLSMGLKLDCPQLHELRGLAIDRIFIDLMEQKISPKRILVNIFNIKEFLLLYAIFEGALKDKLLRDGAIDQGKFLREGELFKKVFQNLNERKGNFFSILSARSSIQSEVALEEFWGFFTHVRHLLIHAGGKVTEKWKTSYGSKKEKTITVVENGECPISNNLLAECIDEMEAATGEIFYLSDSMLNIFRNMVVAVMESLYLLELGEV